jgi:hypothetical protein
MLNCRLKTFQEPGEYPHDHTQERPKDQGWAMLPTGARFGSRFGFLSKLYIDPDPGAAHCWPISVHMRFDFKLYISIIKMLTKETFLSQTEHTLTQCASQPFFVWISSSVWRLLLLWVVMASQKYC